MQDGFLTDFNLYEFLILHDRFFIFYEDLFHDSGLIGTQFRVRCLEETRVGELQAVIPEVTGSAHISGQHQFILDQRDPLQGGFLLR